MTKDELRGVIALMGHYLLIEPSVHTIGGTYAGFGADEETARFNPIKGAHGQTEEEALERLTDLILKIKPE